MEDPVTEQPAASEPAPALAAPWEIKTPGEDGWRSLKPPLPTAARPQSARASLTASYVATTASSSSSAAAAKQVPLPMYCSGMSPIFQPKMQPMRPPSAAAPSPAAASEKKPHQQWAEDNAWVMGGTLIHRKPKLAPTGAGGLTQRMLQTGELTREELGKKMEKRAQSIHHGRPSVPRQSGPSGGMGDRRGHSWRANMLPKGSEAQASAEEARRNKAAAAEAMETAAAEARAEALAQRVAESQERLAARQGLCAALRARRHAEWVEARLHSGLTKVLAPARDPLTRRAIHLAADNETLTHARAGAADFDGLAAPSKERQVAVVSRSRVRHGNDGEERVRKRIEARALAEQQAATSQELAAMVAVVEVDGRKSP